MSKQPPPAPTASAVSPCPTVIQIVGRPGTGSLPSTILYRGNAQLFINRVMTFCQFQPFKHQKSLVTAIPLLFIKGFSLNFRDILATI